ncbi:hypothetical protein EON79_13120 [bacterium]|nr:MAG: hypothetical protein EON79_13120 [bacterium]
MAHDLERRIALDVASLDIKKRRVVHRFSRIDVHLELLTVSEFIPKAVTSPLPIKGGATVLGHRDRASKVNRLGSGIKTHLERTGEVTDDAEEDKRRCQKQPDADPHSYASPL